MHNMSWITKQIAIGGAFIDEDISSLKKEGINVIVDMRSENSDNEELLKKYGIDYLRVKVDDTFTPSFKQIKDIMNFIEPFLNSGRKVLIHCQNGAGRAPLVGVAVLVYRGMSSPDALKLIKQRHPKCGFTKNQQFFIANDLSKFIESEARK